MPEVMKMHPRAAFLAEFFHSDQAKLIVFVFCFLFFPSHTMVAEVG